MTDTQLFVWPELMALSAQVQRSLLISLTRHSLQQGDDDTKPEFRFVTSQTGIRPNSYTQYAMPKDIADISRDRDVNKLADVISVGRAIDWNRRFICAGLESNTRAEQQHGE